MKVKTRTFKNPVVLRYMLVLRVNGWPIKELGFLFGCDHTSIRKACLRNGLPPELPLLPRPEITFKRVVYDFDGERINQGKSYREYREEARRKRQLRGLNIRI